MFLCRRCTEGRETPCQSCGMAEDDVCARESECLWGSSLWGSVMVQCYVIDYLPARPPHPWDANSDRLLVTHFLSECCFSSRAFKGTGVQLRGFVLLSQMWITSEWMTNENGIAPLGQKTFIELKPLLCDAVILYLVRLGCITETWRKVTQICRFFSDGGVLLKLASNYSLNFI